MPWNDQSNGGPWGGSGGGGRGGPWGQGPRGPRGGGPRGPGQQPPDLEDLIRQMQDRFGKMFGGGRGGRGGGFAPIALVLIMALGAWVAWPGSGWYIVEANQVGVVLRFGKFHREEGNGFHLKLPYPLEVAETPAAEESQTARIDGSQRGQRGARSGQTSSETLMLTGDGNIVDLQFRVQWEVGNRPGDVADFLFKIDDPEGALLSVAESAMREIIGQTPLQPILANEIGDISRRVQALIQQTLDEYEAGIEIRNVIIERPALPSAENPGDRGNVERDPLAAFRDVENAEQERQRSIEDARATANRVVPEARGDAERIIQQANAYRDSVIAEAAGEAERFRLIYEQYRLAPEVTRQRMFLETLERVLGSSEKVIIDDEGGGVVPYLPLNELNRGGAGARTNNQ